MGIATDLAKVLGKQLFRLPRYQLEDGTLNPKYNEEAHMWRVKIASGVATSLLWLAALTLVSYGLLLPDYFGSGFARADETTKAVGNIEAEILAEKIEKVETALCMLAEGQGDPELLARRRELRKRYRDLTGHDPDTPGCSLLLKMRQ